MRSNPTEPRSISSQLVLRFTIAAALLLCCGLAILYWIVVAHADEEDNEALTDKFFAVRADLQSEDGPQFLQKELSAPRPRERVTYWVRVLDPAGRTLAETVGMSALLPVELFPKPAQAGARVDPIEVRTHDRLFGLMAVNDIDAERPYQIQLAQDRSVDEQFTRHFGLLVIAVLAVGCLVAALIARTVTRRGLRPLGEIVQSLERTGPTRLHERVEPESWPRELQPLVIAYDGMLDRLEDSFTRLSQFSADLAHELRTPVANLRGEAEVALRRPRTADEYQAVIESSVAECERLSALIDNLLFLARAEAAKELATRTHFDGRPAIDKITGYFGAIAEEHHINIQCEGAGEIYADSLLFSRAVSNLVENALRYSPDGGEIRIAISVDAHEARVTVQDDGPGIAAADLPRVFDRFYRADPSRSSQGSGLGLALVKSIADLHGGSARAENTSVGGAIVTLVFPKRNTEVSWSGTEKSENG